jgi:hypothetical protein
MQSPFPFESMLLFGCLAIMLLIGVLLRAKIAFFQRFLMPSCLIGGILGLILINVNCEFVPVANLETFAYHLFNISFISVGLVYVLTHGLVKYLGHIVPADVASILWGFFFIFGLGIALGIRWIMKRLGAEHLIDPGIQRRITGWSVDFLIVSIGFYLVLVNGPLWWDWSIGTTLLVFLGLMILALGFIRVLKFWGSPKF